MLNRGFFDYRISEVATSHVQLSYSELSNFYGDVLYSKIIVSISLQVQRLI